MSTQHSLSVCVTRMCLEKKTAEQTGMTFEGADSDATKGIMY